MGSATGVSKKRLVLLLWVLVAFFYFYLSYDYIRVSMNDRTFGDYMDYVVRIAGTESRPAREVRELLLVKADELTLPVSSDQITIQGLGESLDVTVNYQVPIDVPLLEKTVFTKQFNHQARYHQFQ